jgi:hypothetical protein
MGIEYGYQSGHVDAKSKLPATPTPIDTRAVYPTGRMPSIRIGTLAAFVEAQAVR